MPSKELPQFLNFDDQNQKRQLLLHIGSLKGQYAVTLQPRKYLRSLTANAYYWACCVQPFRDQLRRDYGDPLIRLEDAHEILKNRLLPPRSLTNKETGETMDMPPSTAVLDITEFGAYLQRVIGFLAECGIVVVEPIPKREAKSSELDEQPVEVPI